MRVHRQLKTLITFATVASLAACAPYGRQGGGAAVVSVRWDSGPLDRDYTRVHGDMIARHNQEIASPRSDESADVSNQRLASERQDLELRYSRGKSAHSDKLPPSER
jgi:hypothetical protein